MTKRAGVKFRASCGRLRRFAICILLLAIGALVLQVPVHASPTGHAILNRPGFTGGQNSRRIARYGTDIEEEDLEAVFI